MRPPAPAAPEETLPMQAIRRVGPLWAALAVAAVLLLTVSAAAVLGYRAGLTKHADLAATERAVDIAAQYALGLDDLAAGHLLTAGERFRYILSLEPNHAGAAQGLAEVEARQSLTATAPASAAATRPASGPETPPGDLLAQAESALAAADWDGALAPLGELQRTHPDFEAARVQAALHQAYRERGLARITDFRLQEGILDLDQAELYGELNEDAEARRVWATLYVRGNALWGADWPAAIFLFEDLYRAAPYFHDTAAKLHGAHVGYGDQLWAGGDPCGAADEYARAVEVLADEAVAAKGQAARQECEAGTPTPEGGEAAPEASPAP